MARRTTFFSVLVAGIVAGIPVSAAASAPLVTENDFAETTALPTSWCGFPLRVTFEGHVRMTQFLDQDGNVVRVQLDGTDTATVINPANGKSVSGHETLFRQVNFTKERGFDVGIPIHWGNLVMDAGRYYYDAAGDVSFAGNFQFTEGEWKLSDFCSAFA